MNLDWNIDGRGAGEAAPGTTDLIGTYLSYEESDECSPPSSDLQFLLTPLYKRSRKMEPEVSHAGPRQHS